MAIQIQRTTGNKSLVWKKTQKPKYKNLQFWLFKKIRELVKNRRFGGGSFIIII